MIPLLAGLPGACSAPANRSPQRATSPVPAVVRAAASATTEADTLAATMPSDTQPATQPTSEPTTRFTGPSTERSTEPTTRSAVPPPHGPTSVPTLPPLSGIKEGTYLANRVGRLRFNPMGPYPRFEFFEKGVRVQVELLPDRNLMAMEQAAFLDELLRFDVSGTVTNYNGKCYLLVERVSRALPASHPSTTAASQS